MEQQQVKQKIGGCFGDTQLWKQAPIRNRWNKAIAYDKNVCACDLS